MVVTRPPRPLANSNIGANPGDTSVFNDAWNQNDPSSSVLECGELKEVEGFLRLERRQRWQPADPQHASALTSDVERPVRLVGQWIEEP